ncbi:MAG: exodeoxyribonuclease VII large subunit [Lachnospiraceae bacterium]|nr:exodeoxyribonuclease VII large subunit [Lachnospiraceae bacterium]
MKSIYSVGQINTYIRNMFAQDYLLHQVAVRGEVSNCKYHSSGHIYFTLKDTSGTLSCVMFAGRRRGLSFTMREGDQVIVTGAVDVYERDGRYQLYADRIIRDGVGLLNERYEALKRSLEERGMFDEQYKQPIPRFIRTLGVVTAPTGAAVRDIINIASRRNPYVEIILYPAQVQGDGAAESIVRGIRALEQIGVDTMIIGRGGGSIEDLWAFNEEIVAQAVFDCTVPIISAVGHETDTVISDYVADRRAPTPSAAAELAVYEMRQLDEQLAAGLASLRQSMASRIAQERMRTASMERALQSLSPSSRVRERRMRAMQLQELYELRMREKLSLLRHRLERTAGLLEAQSPVARMAAGYGYLTDGDGKQIRSVLQVQAGDCIGIRIRDGKIRAQVTDTGVDRL